nr:hypothetical protein BaRGS_001419 [Batillaria attramentaria]
MLSMLGAYFGAALAVSDLNGDGKDDIIVGAPFYSDFEGINYEMGRVYIYYQNPNFEFKEHKRDLLDGKRSRARFGMALSHLGDINYDGYNDLGVGAPYDGEDGKGAVYVYHGSKKGIITQASQVILAKEVDTGLTTFGSSLSGGWDQDGNRYPEHDQCMKVYSCLEYDGVGVPDELYFDASWELDTLQRNLTRAEQRAFFTNNPLSFRENNTYKLTYKNMMCTNSYAYVKPELLDKLTPIAVDFNFKLHERTPSGRRRRDLEPILDQYIPTSVRTEAQILKDCGADNKCIPDLSLVSFRVTAAHIIGRSEELEIMVIVENRKEDAFNTRLYVNLPPGVSFRNKAGVQSSSFTLRVSAKDTNETTDALIFILQVNSTNPEELSDTKDNSATVEIPVTASADITIYG